MKIANIVWGLIALAVVMSIFGSIVLISIVTDDARHVNPIELIAFIAAVLCMLLMAAGLVIVKLKMKPIGMLSEYIESIAAGDLGVSMDRDSLENSEIGGLVVGVYDLVGIVNEMANDLTEMHIKFTEEGDVDFRAKPEKYGQFRTIQDIINSINALLDDFKKDESVLLNILTKISEGSMDFEIPKLPGKKAIVTNQLETSVANLKGFVDALGLFAQSVAVGRLNEEIDVKKFSGNWTVLARDLNKALFNIHEPFEVIMTVMDAMKKGDFRYRAEGDYQGMLRDITNAVNTTMESISSYVDELDKILDDIAGGNLKGKIERQYVGSFDLIKNSVNSILNRLNETMTDIDLVAQGVSTGAMQLSQSSMALSQGVSQQMAGLEELSEGISDVDRQSADNATNASIASDLSEASRKSAIIGNKDMQSLLEAMEKINDSTSQISLIIKTIEDIAFQTNLLALNASVEASRAGIHGSGFAVVADAVRALANRSGDAAQETSALIKSSVASVTDGMKRANDTAGSLEKIVQAVTDVSGVVRDIQKASTNQTEAINTITEGLSEISTMIQQDAATGEETAAAAEELDAQVVTLQQKLSYFKTRESAGSILSKTWVVATLPDEGIDQVKSVSGNNRKFHAGETIMMEGDESDDSMYFLLQGNVDVFKGYKKANQTKLATLRTGDMFGEMSLFLGEPRSATVVARETVEVMQVKQKDMAKFIENHPDVAYDITTSMCVKLRSMLDALDVE